MKYLHVLFASLAVGCGSTGATSQTSQHPLVPEQSSDAKLSRTPSVGKPVALPVLFAANRFFVTPKTADGKSMVFATDTGGGLFVSEATVRRLGLSVAKVVADGGQVDAAKLPRFAANAWIPSFAALEGRLPILPDAKVRQYGQVDGLLGQAWFQDRVWTFDYLEKELLWRAANDVPAADVSHRVPLGFPTDEKGHRTTSYPRIQIKVDGEPIDLLFDTGATVYLSESALKRLGDGGPPMRGTSFISKTTFQKWQELHPEWIVVDNADRTAAGEPMIQVPLVEIAGFTVGPVWFTRRQDANYHTWMSQWMDTPIDGALGGSALQYFRVTVDYPNAVAYFEGAAS